jgi:hypothetical protein
MSSGTPFRNEVFDSIKYLSNIKPFQNKWITDDVMLNLLQEHISNDIISISNKNTLTTKKH